MEFYLGIAILTLSLVLLLRAFISRRVGDTPFCRKCKFELTGLTDPSRCPECGRELNSAWAIRIGKGRVRMRPMRWGLALAIIGGAFVGIDAMNRSGFVNVTSIKPAWLLYKEAYLLGDRRASSATEEIVSRGQAGKLPPDWNSRILTISLDRHAQTWRAFPYAQWAVIIDGFASHSIGNTRRDQLFDDATGPIDIVNLGYLGKTEVYPGEALAFDVVMNWRAGGDYGSYFSSTPYVELRTVGFELKSVMHQATYSEQNGDLQEYIAKSSNYGSIHRSTYAADGATDLSLLYEIPKDIEPGTYTATIQLHIYRVDFSDPGVQISLLDSLWHRAENSRKTIEHSFPVVIAPIDSNDATMVTIDSLGEGTPTDLLRFVVTDKDVMFGHTPVIEFEIGIPPMKPSLTLLGKLIFTQGELEYGFSIWQDSSQQVATERIMLSKFEPGKINIRYEHDTVLAHRMRNEVQRLLVGPIDLGEYMMPEYSETRGR